MKDMLPRFLRAVLFALLALTGMAMVLIFMFSTAIAVGILYVIAKVRGKPFGARAYWSQRQSARPGPFKPTATSFTPSRDDVIDVKVREIR
jgi:hypothetical protein